MTDRCIFCSLVKVILKYCEPFLLKSIFCMITIQYFLLLLDSQPKRKLSCPFTVNIGWSVGGYLTRNFLTCPSSFFFDSLTAEGSLVVNRCVGLTLAICTFMQTFALSMSIVHLILAFATYFTLVPGRAS